jgi:hypothetical protein
MATKVLGPFNPDPAISQKNGILVANPFQGQGQNPWKALIRNVSPWPLFTIAGVYSYWIGPYEEDYYEFPGPLTSFTMIPVPQPLFPVVVVGFVLVTAFDQSSKYDGTFPCAITPPSLQLPPPPPHSIAASVQLKQTGHLVHWLGPPASVPLRIGVAFLSDPNNVGKIYIGDSNITNGGAYVTPGQGDVLPLADLNELYTIGTNNDILSVWGA